MNSCSLFNDVRPSRSLGTIGETQLGSDYLMRLFWGYYDIAEDCLRMVVGETLVGIDYICGCIREGLFGMNYVEGLNSWRETFQEGLYDRDYLGDTV